MAVGDVVSALSSVATGAFHDVQPAAGIEWVIHNVYAEADVELRYFDGVNEIIFDSSVGAKWFANLRIHVNNTRRLRVKNTNAAAKLIAYDGVQTK